VYKPYKVRNYYKKYKNVWVAPSYVIFLGDAYNYVKNIMNDRIFYYHFKEEAKEVNNYDFKLEMIGVNPQVKPVSYAAQKAFEDHCPRVFDKVRENMCLGKIIKDSFGQSRSNENAMHRRRTFMKLLSFNACSKYIPTMLECCKQEIGAWKIGEEREGLYEMNMVTFGFFNLAMFGKDMMNVGLKTFDYEKDDGTMMKITMRDSLMEITKNMIESMKHPLTAFLPIMNEKELCNPFKRNRRNLNAFRKVLKQFLDQVTDEESVIKALLDDKSIDNDEMFEDLLGFMCAGTETSAHTLTTLFYHVKKKPEVLEKIKEELKENGFFDYDNLEAAYNYDNLMKLEYLNNSIKEALRIDAPVFETMEYKTWEDIEVLGVKFPKNTIFKKDLYIPHYDEKEYFYPREFIPERFDPESDLFYKPNSDKKSRRPYSYCPFGYGHRACPGQSFSMLELKVACCYFFTHVEYNVEQKLLDNEYVGWAVCTPYKLPMKITERLGSKK
jgi:cytochrome P450